MNDTVDACVVLESTKVFESWENVFGERLLQQTSTVAQNFQLARTQYISMQLYEGRIASLQRAVAFFVLFHEMATTVVNFWSFVSFGLLSYRIDRTQSIMRVATTASPVSGADVRHKMIELRVQEKLARMKAGLHGVCRNFQDSQICCFNLQGPHTSGARESECNSFEMNYMVPCAAYIAGKTCCCNRYPRSC